MSCTYLSLCAFKKGELQLIAARARGGARTRTVARRRPGWTEESRINLTQTAQTNQQPADLRT